MIVFINVRDTFIEVTPMKEHEINAIFDIVPDPEKSFVNIHERKIFLEVERIVTVFNLVKKQNEELKGNAIVNYTNLDLLPCEN